MNISSALETTIRGMKNIHIEVPSLSENIRMIESFIDNAKEKFQLNDDIYGNIMIAITEAVSNAIKHGNQSDSSKNGSLSLSLDDSLIKFIVEDEGQGFDFENLPDPTAAENIEKPRGRGTFLIKHKSHQVKCKKGGRCADCAF